MSAQFPFQGGQGGALPSNPTAGGYPPNMYNGAPPPNASNPNFQPSMKGMPPAAYPNGPPMGHQGGAMGQAPAPGFPAHGNQMRPPGPGTFPGAPPTSQFNNMNIGDQVRPGGIPPQRPGMPPSSQPQMNGFQTRPVGHPPSSNGGFVPTSASGAPYSPMGGALPPSSMSGMPPSSMGSGLPPNSAGGGMPPPASGGMPPPMSGAMPPQMGGRMPPPSMGGGVPPPGGSGMPPPMSGGMRPSMAGGMPPSLMGGGLPPSSMGGGMPPSSMGGGMPPSSMGSGMPPSSMGAGMPPSSMGSGMPPSSMGGGMPPSSMGVGMPPPSMGGGMPPSSMGGGMPPSSMGGGMPPPSMGGGMPPSSMGGSVPPNPMAPQPTPSGPGVGAPPTGQGMRPRYPQQPGYMGQAPPTNQYSGPPQGSHFGGNVSADLASPPGQSMHPPVPPPSGPKPGYPPVPGQMPSQPGQFPGSMPYNPQQPPTMGYGGQPGQQPPPPAPMQQPQQKRLDPDQMPSPIQVIEDDRRTRSGLFQTNTRGSVPPLVTTNFTTQDQGNANPRFIRSTMYNVPCTADMLKSSHIPFALALSPFAEVGPQEQPPPIVDLGELGPVRCKRCRAYMNPFMQFVDGGRRFQCAFCGATTDVPNEYFAHLDHTGRRVDCYNRPELCLGSYEFAATKDYCKNGIPPKEPAFIFMIDVSYNSVKSGLVHLICDKLKSEILVNLPRETGASESEIRVGFVTYHKELHFYNVKSTLAQPQMMVVSDLDDMFVPLVDGFLVKLSESEAVIDSLLSQIPQMFAESKETELCLGPVIQAGLDALQSAERAGRLYIFHTGLPTAEAPGKLKNRDDRKLLGTEKEKTILSPQSQFYTKLGTECVAAGCSVDLFLFPNQYIDVASMSDICRVTSGNIFKYSYFQADIDGERFIEDLKMTVQRSQAFDAILRVRTSTGIRPVDFYGNFYMANTTDVEMASIDSDSSVSLEVKHDDKLSESEGAYVQVAVLYTSISGKRRLRCHNLSFNCCAQMADLFRSCELDVLINFFAKQAIRTSLNANPKQVREHIMNETAQILACYRKNCANPSSPGQLVLPECMKLLPLYANCVIKNDSISGGSEISTDDRSFLMHLVNGMDPQMSNVFFYPSLLPFHNLDMESSETPTAIRCSLERLEDNGIYLLENGLSLFLWIGHNVSPEMIQNIFAVPSAAQVDIDKVQVLQLDNPVSRRLCDLIAALRERRSRYLKLTIVRQRDKLEPWFNHFLVEDKGMGSGSSYVDFLCHIHKEIRNILN